MVNESYLRINSQFGRHWTRRMEDVAEAADQLVAEGQRPTLRAIGEMVGLSVERVRQLRWQVERYQEIPHAADDHVKRYRRLMLDAVQALAGAARQAGAKAGRARLNVMLRHRLPTAVQMRRQFDRGRRLVGRLDAEAYAAERETWDIRSRTRDRTRSEVEAEIKARRLAQQRQARASASRAQRLRNAIAAEIAADPRLAELDALYRQRIRNGDNR
jgi:hypothetical protein